MKRSLGESGSDHQRKKQPRETAIAIHDDQLDADEKLARQLAAEEGLLLPQHSKWGSTSTLKSSSKPNQSSKLKGKAKEAQQLPTLELDDESDDDLIVVEDSEPKVKVETTPRTPQNPLASLFVKQSPASTSKVKLEDSGHSAARSPVVKSSLVQSPSVKSESGSSFFASIKNESPRSAKTAAQSSRTPRLSRFIAEKPLDTSVYEYNPATDVDTSGWPLGRMPYSYLTQAFVIISATKSRLLISRVLTNLLRTAIELDPESLEAITYLTTNRLGPSHEKDLELGIGSQVLGGAIKGVSGLTPAALRQLNKLGDPGDVAFEAKKNVRLLVQPTPLVCHSVFTALLGMTKMKGQGSVERKTATVKKMLVAAQGEEVRFITRTLCANLRIGAVRLTLTSALAKAFCLSRKNGLDENEHEPDDGFWVSMDERAKVLKQLRGAKQGKLKVKEEEERKVEAKMEKAEQLVRRVYARHPHYGHIIAALLASAFDDLETKVPLAVGTPIEPMLGSITRALSEIYTRLGSRPFVAEAKLDGQRGQIHVSTTEPAGEKGKGSWYDPPPGTEGKRVWVRVFSRHLLEMTDKYPDIAYTLSALVHRESSSEQPLTDFIVDCEIVAIDPATGAFKTFQELSYRSRKDVEMGDIKVRVGIYAFDLMYLNGQSLLGEPFRKRRELLRSRFAPMRAEDLRLAKWELIPSCTDNEPDKVRAFFEETLKMRAEGIMVKLLDEAEVEVASDAEDDEALQEGDIVESNEVDEDASALTATSPSKGKKTGGKRRKTLPATYEPDKRADSWLKVKKDYLEDLGDSLDLIPIGGWHGMGRKAAWWSPILLGCYDQETGSIQAVCKCMSGFSDAFYAENKAKYHEDGELTTRVKPTEIEGGNLKPSVWFKPSEVWEIRGADFTLSPVYPAAQSLLGERGVSVRFPRFMKIREDKGIEQATSSEQLAAMFEKQGTGAGSGPAPNGGTKTEEEDF